MADEEKLVDDEKPADDKKLADDEKPGSSAQGGVRNLATKVSSFFKDDTSGRATHWSARQLAIMAILVALGAVLAFIGLPIVPFLPTVTYDAANVPAIIGSLIFGPVAGCIIGVLSFLIYLLFSGDVIGVCINIVLMIGFIVPAALICKKSKSIPRLIIGLVVGCVVVLILMVPTNLIGWYLYAGNPFETTLDFVIPFLLPMNLFKVLMNSVLSFILYKSLHKLIERQL